MSIVFFKNSVIIKKIKVLLSEKVGFEQRPEEEKGASHVAL